MAICGTIFDCKDTVLQCWVLPQAKQWITNRFFKTQLTEQERTQRRWCVQFLQTEGKKSTNIHIIFSSYEEEKSRIGQGWFSCCVSSHIGHRAYGKYLVVTTSEKIIGETNSQLQSDWRRWKKRVSRHMVMLWYIGYCNQLFFNMPLASTDLTTLLDFGRWLMHNTSVPLIEGFLLHWDLC